MGFCPGTSNRRSQPPPERNSRQLVGALLRPRLDKQLLEQSPARRQALIRQQDRLCLADRVINHPLAVQTVKGIPIMTLPRSDLVVQRQAKQCQHRIVDLVCVNLHHCSLKPTLPMRSSPSAQRYVNRVDRKTLTLLSMSATLIPQASDARNRPHTPW